MLSIKARAFAPLCNRSLEDLVPATSFYRQLDAMLDLSFVRDWVQDAYAPAGRPSIDPVVFFKLQLIRFFEGLRSERQLMQVVADRLSLRWYLGYDWDEPLPDHSSLTKIRERYGLPSFQRFFEHVVELCQAAGLVWGKELFFDGTKVRANADVDSLSPRFYQRAKQHVEDLFAETSVDEGGASDGPPVSAASEPVDGPSCTADIPPTPQPVPLPLVGTAAAERLAVENQEAWKLLEQCRLDPTRPPSGPYRRITDFRASTTDPDAAPMHTDGGTKLGYSDHYVVDGGKARIILAALVTPADVQDNQALLDLLDRVHFRYQLPVRRAVGDSKYGTGENLRALEERGITAYMPVADYDRSSPFFRQQDFTYDPAQDWYNCPQGVHLTYRGNNYVSGVRSYQAPRAVCQACPVRERCTDSKQGRRVNRPFDEDYRERARQRQETEPYRKAMRKRQVWVEPLFGEAKDWHGLRRFRLRGLWKVNCEALLTAAGQNLKRWLSKLGWGRQDGPPSSAIRSRFSSRSVAPTGILA